MDDEWMDDEWMDDEWMDDGLMDDGLMDDGLMDDEWMDDGCFTCLLTSCSLSFPDKFRKFFPHSIFTGKVTTPSIGDICRYCAVLVTD